MAQSLRKAWLHVSYHTVGEVAFPSVPLDEPPDGSGGLLCTLSWMLVRWTVAMACESVGGQYTESNCASRGDG